MSNSDNSIFVSFSDLMSGLFLVLLVALLIAMQHYNLLQEERDEEGDAVRATKLAKLRVEEVVKALAQDGTPVRVEVLGPGALRISVERSLFERGHTNPRHSLVPELVVLGERLVENVLSEGGRAVATEKIVGAPCFLVEVQGHADASPVQDRRHRYRDNLELSALRAIQVEMLLRKGLPDGDEASTIWNTRVLVAGFGDRRPLKGRSPEAPENRRIDIEATWRWYLPGCEKTPPLFASASSESSSSDGIKHTGTPTN
jgi:chemotaxis protein MotB